MWLDLTLPLMVLLHPSYSAILSTWSSSFPSHYPVPLLTCVKWPTLSSFLATHSHYLTYPCSFFLPFTLHPHTQLFLSDNCTAPCIPIEFSLVYNGYLCLPRNRPEGKVLETVGVFEAPKLQGKYETGQVRDLWFDLKTGIPDLSLNIPQEFPSGINHSLSKDKFISTLI